MAVTTKYLRVRASAGDGIGTPIPPALAFYCEKLQLVQPTSFVQTDDRDTDLASIHSAAVLKGLQLDPEVYGVNCTWKPEHYHEVDPQNPSLWSSNANARSIIYKAQLTDGSVMYFSVGTT